jgi:hypothetical protein
LAAAPAPPSEEDDAELLMRADDEPEEDPVPVAPLVQEKPLLAALPVEEEPILLKPPVETGTTTRPSTPGACPACRCPMQPGAVICLECGYDARIGRQRETVAKRVRQRWEAGWPYALRLTLFVGVVVLTAPVVLIALLRVPWVLIFLIPSLIGLLFVLGDHFVIEIERSRKGRLMIRADRCLAFVPVRPVVVSVEECGALVVEHSHRFDYHMILLLFLGCPGWVVFAIRLGSGATEKHSFRICLRLHRGIEDRFLFRGRSDRKMRELVNLLQEATGLPVERR